MKTAVITLCAIITTSVGLAQNRSVFTYQNFEAQILSYVPKKHADINENQFEYGKMILSETKSATKGVPQNFNIADYLNVLSAFITLKESTSNIHLAYQKFEDAPGSCEYFKAFESRFESNAKYAIIIDKFREKLKTCNAGANTASGKVNAKNPDTAPPLDLQLVKLINQVNTNDQKYRGKDAQDFKLKQQALDAKNQKVIDSLYAKYGTYIGKSLVGEKLQTVMWAVIQHSNTAMMEKYLPVVKEAVDKKELGVTPLKMLIDRYYGLVYGYQVFGSQSGFGFKLADDQTRKAIKKTYGLE